MSKTASAPYHVVRTICREHGTEGGFMSAKEYSSDPAIHLGPYSLVVFRSLDLFIVQASGSSPRLSVVEQVFNGVFDCGHRGHPRLAVQMSREEHHGTK
jgi:hypothetical protein